MDEDLNKPYRIIISHIDFLHADKYNPGHLMTHKWENAFTLDKTSWGFNRNATEADYLTKDELLHEVVSTIAYGGNCLINIGPTADGR